MRITNKDIYEEIKQLQRINQEEHAVLKEHAMSTNGKVKLNRWISTTALSIVLVLLGFLVNHIASSHV